MTTQKTTPGINPGARVSLQSDYAKKIVNGQIKKGYVLEIILPGTETAEPHKFYIGASNAARSLLIMYAIKMGVTRAEALGAYFVLNITQHVHTMRHKWGLEIETEPVPPTRYARYHLISPVIVNIFVRGK
jgi:hypothetical protein